MMVWNAAIGFLNVHQGPVRTVETSFIKIAADIRRYAEREGRTKVGLAFAIRMILVTPGFQFVLLRRIQELVVRIPIIGRALRRVIWWATSIAFGSEIAMAAEIGGGLYVPHPYGIVIGAARIGKNVSILQNVTIGRRSPKDTRDPIILDGATVSASATVVGSITIGENAVIGANSLVTTDVPENSLAIGVPATVKMRQSTSTVNATS